MPPVLKVGHVRGVIAELADGLLEEADLAVVEAVGDVGADVAGGVPRRDVLAVRGGGLGVAVLAGLGGLLGGFVERFVPFQAGEGVVCAVDVVVEEGEVFVGLVVGGEVGLVGGGGTGEAVTTRCGGGRCCRRGLLGSGRLGHGRAGDLLLYIAVGRICRWR